MRKNLKFLGLGLAVLALAALFACAWPVHAEEDGGERNIVTDMRGVNKYHWYWYPSSHTYFVLPNKYETRFDIHNGLFCELYYREYLPHGEMDEFRARSGDLDTLHMQANVSFYTPTGEFIGDYNRIQPNVVFAIPVNSRSLEYDRLQVKIENYSRYTREMRFLVIAPTADNVNGTPIPGVYRQP